jgi:cobalt-precorrin 5A hydrolase
MVGDETMIAVGLGCRKGCAGEAIAALVQRALAAAHCNDAPATLFTLAGKRNEPGLAAAAQELRMPLVFLEVEILQQASGRAATRSERVLRLFGLPSIAETAALAGAGPASVLLLPRISEGGASCAIAGKGQT